MASKILCVSCRLENKAVCYSPSPLSQYCSDFKLFPAIVTGTNNKSDGSRSDKEKKESMEWAFQGNDEAEIKFVEDIENDFDAIGNDSGYFSSDGFHATPSVESSSDNYENDDEGRDTAQLTDYSDTAASVEPHHGSIFDMIDITDVRTRSASSLGHKPEEHDGDWPPLFDGEVTSPTPLESWAQEPHRHESLAYRLEAPKN